jgi:hypothetical protein
VIATCRKFLRQNLSPKAFQYVRSSWWHSRFYLPHLVASLFVRRTPKIQDFSEGRASELVSQLRDVNVLTPTEMCRVMTLYGSDKGQGWHNYTTIYSALFGKLRDQPLRILELGLGTDNPELASSMRGNGCPGGSLRGWRKLFPQALVYGADIDRHILFEEEHIKTFYCDQLDRVSIRDLWSQPPLQDGCDIIVDDGLHTFEANVSFLDASLEHLHRGGFFVIEDIVQETVRKWRECLETRYAKCFPNHEFLFLEIPSSTNNYDNNLLLVHRSR